MNLRYRDALANVLTGRLQRRTALARLAGGTATALLAAVAPQGLSGWRAGAQTTTPPAGSEGYAVIRRYQLKPDASMDELVRRVDEGFVPIIKGIPGFLEYLFVDAGEGAHLTMSLYSDPGGAEASTRDASSWAAENVAELIEGPPQVTEGWIRIHVDASETGATPTA